MPCRASRSVRGAPAALTASTGREVKCTASARSAMYPAPPAATCEAISARHRSADSSGVKRRAESERDGWNTLIKTRHRPASSRTHVRTGIACAHVQAQRQGGPAVAARARHQAQRAVGDSRHARAVAGRDRGPQLVARAGRHAHHAARAALAHVRRLLRGHTAGRPPARRARLHAHRCTLVCGRHTGLEAALLLAYMSVYTPVQSAQSGAPLVPNTSCLQAAPAACCCTHERGPKRFNCARRGAPSAS